MKRIAVLVLALFPLAAWSAPPPARKATDAAHAARRNSSYIDARGTAHVTRVVPVPLTISPQARRFLSRRVPDVPGDTPLAQLRKKFDRLQASSEKAYLKRYPAKVARATLAGVPVRIVTPPVIPPAHRDYVLMNLHGGGFIVDTGSLLESIPIASLTRTEVVAVLYPLAPEHPYPAAVDAAVKVYRQLLKNYPPGHIVIYGTSAGAMLTPEVAVALKQRGLPQPGALGVFSGMGDFSREGDSMSLFGLEGLSGPLARPWDLPRYVGSTKPRDPGLSPLFANLHGLPPTLFLTSTRDLLLSGTTILERAFRRAGVHTRLIVFEALPHAFWYHLSLPESRQAYRDMAGFFMRHLYPRSPRPKH